MKNQMTWMLVGSVSIVLLLFLLPGIGFNGSNSLFIFLIIFFVAHIFMMKNHGGHGSHSGHGGDQENQIKNKEDHAKHQH